MTQVEIREDEIQMQVMEIVQTMAPLRVESLNRETRLEEDLGYTSLRLFELAIVLESQFAVELPMEETMQVRTIGDVRELVAHLVGCQQA